MTSILVRLVVIKALAALLAEPASVNHLSKQDTGAVFGVAGLVVEDLHDGKAGVQADKVGELKRAHGDVGAVLHDGIDGVAVAYVGLEADDGFVNVRHQDTVGKEAGGVGRDGGNLAHLLAELDGSVESLLAGLETADDLDTLLDGDGVHEVGGDDAGRGRGVGRIGRGGSGNLGDGDGRGVGGKNGVGRAHLGEVGEDVKLELGDLGDSLDDKVDGGQVLDLGRTGQKGANLGSLILCDSFLGDILGEKLIYKIV